MFQAHKVPSDQVLNQVGSDLPMSSGSDMVNTLGARLPGQAPMFRAMVILGHKGVGKTMARELGPFLDTGSISQIDL